MYKLEDFHFWFVGKRYFIDSVLKKYSKNIKNVLDLGSGTGGLTKYLEKYGAVTGIEEYPYAIKLAKKRGVNLKKANIQKLKLGNKKFDLVTIFDVLYHQDIKDESLVLKNAHKHLRKGGYLLITDSALPFLKGPHDVATLGARRYTVREMVKLVESNGFKVLKASYVYFSIFPFVLIKRLIFDRVSRSKTSDVGPINPLFNSILMFFLKIEANLLKTMSFPIGSSVIILAKKDASSH